MKPFLKWAGGKRWLADRTEFSIPPYSGKYIEPFLGGGAVFFHISPRKARLSDSNNRLIETYGAVRTHWRKVFAELTRHHELHSHTHYYAERSQEYRSAIKRAAQFIYLNRTCWNGLYRENLRGEFNVPIGTKSLVIYPDDDFESLSSALEHAEIDCCDFEKTISRARPDDFLFVDPPYTTAHNMNGFIKYNQNIFSWDDQIRLQKAVKKAAEKGCKVVVTNAAHESVFKLYDGWSEITEVTRASVISGSVTGRRGTKEFLIRIGFAHA